MNSSFLSRAAAAATSVAVAAAFALPVQAAAITTITVNGDNVLNATEAVATVVFTPVTALTNGSSIVVTYPSTFTDTSFVAGNVTPTQTGATFGTPVVDTTANTITLPVTTGGGTNAVTVTIASNLVAPASGIASFGVSTSVGDTGAVLVSVANANQVAVTATVLPTLTLALSGTPTLGTVGTTRLNSTGNTTLTVSTNAANGYTLQAAATTSDATDMPLVASNTLEGAAAGFAAFVASVTGATADADFSTQTSTGVLSGTAQDIAARTGVAASDTVVVTYSARAIATTPADNYTMTTTFTATASF